jgi:hypothetical protein
VVISPACIRVAEVVAKSAPNDHLAAVPDRGEVHPAIGHVGGTSGCPTIRAGTVGAARVQIAVRIVVSAPHDHFTARPHCGVLVSRTGGVSGASSRPSVGSRVVSPAGVQKNVGRLFISAPNDHFTSSPDCSVTVSRLRSCIDVSGCPSICARVVSAAGGQCIAIVKATPNNHFTTGPYCRVTFSCAGCVGRGGRRPSIRAGVVSCAGVQMADSIKSTPNNHFSTSPDPLCEGLAR